MDDDDDMPNIDPPSRGVTPAPRDSSASLRQSAAARPSTSGGASGAGPESCRASTPGFSVTPRSSAAGGVPFDDEEEPLRASVAAPALGRDSWAAPSWGGRPSTAGRTSVTSSVWAREVVDGLVDAAADGEHSGDDDAAGRSCDGALEALTDALVAEEAAGDFDEPQPLPSRLSVTLAPHPPRRTATPRRSVHGSLLTAPSRYAEGGSDAEDAPSPRSPGGGFGAQRSSVGARSSLGGGDSTTSVGRARRDLAAIADAGIAAAAVRAAAQQQRAAALAAEQSDADRSDESFCCGSVDAFGGARTPLPSGSARLSRGAAPSSSRRAAAAFSPTRSPPPATLDEPRGLLPEVEAYNAFLSASGGACGGWDPRDHAAFKRSLAACGGDYGRVVDAVLAALPGLYTAAEVAAHAAWDERHEAASAAKRDALQRWRDARAAEKAAAEAAAAAAAAAAKREAAAAAAAERERRNAELEAWRKAKAEKDNAMRATLNAEAIAKAEAKAAAEARRTAELRAKAAAIAAMKKKAAEEKAAEKEAAEAAAKKAKRAAAAEAAAEREAAWQRSMAAAAAKRAAAAERAAPAAERAQRVARAAAAAAAAIEDKIGYDPSRLHRSTAAFRAYEQAAAEGGGGGSVDIAVLKGRAVPSWRRNL